MLCAIRDPIAFKQTSSGSARGFRFMNENVAFRHKIETPVTRGDGTFGRNDSRGKVPRSQ